MERKKVMKKFKEIKCKLSILSPTSIEQSEDGKKIVHAAWFDVPVANLGSEKEPNNDILAFKIDTRTPNKKKFPDMPKSPFENLFRGMGI